MKCHKVPTRRSGFWVNPWIVLSCCGWFSFAIHCRCCGIEMRNNKTHDSCNDSQCRRDWWIEIITFITQMEIVIVVVLLLLFFFAYFSLFLRLIPQGTFKCFRICVIPLVSTAIHCSFTFMHRSGEGGEKTSVWRCELLRKLTRIKVAGEKERETEMDTFR